MLSIIIPTLNEADYLPYLLRSIQAQAFTDYEVIVADNDSTDGTCELAEEYGARVVKGGKVAEGRNLGAEAARGDILLFFDADVVLPDPWFLQMTIAEFEKRKLDVGTCKIHPISDKKIDKVFHELFNYFMWVTRATKPHAPGFCIFIRRDLHKRIEGFDEEIKLAEDHDYAGRAGKIGKFGLLKSYKIPVSVRRFDKDGRLNIAIKYMLCEFHMRTLGMVRSDIFKYNFGHYGEETKKKRFRERMKARLRR